MARYTSKNGLISITDEVSGGYSHHSQVPTNAAVRNKEFKLVLSDCLDMTAKISKLEERQKYYLDYINYHCDHKSITRLVSEYLKLKNTKS